MAMARTKYLLLATSAIASLAFGAGFAAAQSGGPDTQKQHEETQPPAKGGNQVTPGAKPPATTTTPGSKAPAVKPTPQAPGSKGQTQNAPGSTTTPNRQTAPTTAAPTQNGGRAPSPAASSGQTRVQVTQQQRTQIHQTVTREHMHRVDRVEFNVSIGIVVPQTVILYPVPVSIVEIVPAYAGFEYIIVGDQLLIIDPLSLQIVAIFPA